MLSQEGNVDYLKIRVYLYKFTPEMQVINAARADYTPVLRKSTAAQGLIDHTKAIKLSLIDIKSALTSFTLTTKSSYESVKQAVNVVKGLTALDSIRSNNLLILQDSTGNARAAAELNATSSPPVKIPIVFETPRPVANPNNPNEPHIGLGSDPSILGTREGTELKYMTLLQQCDFFTETLSWKSGADFSPEPTYRQTIRKINVIVSNILGFLSAAITKCDAKIFTGEAEKEKFKDDLKNLKEAVKQFKVSRFSYDLNPGDLSRFDLTKFVVGYRTDQMLGDISSCGSINGATTLQNMVIPLADLDKTPSVSSVRRPFYFPDENGSYVGYKGRSVRSYGETERIPTVDPITGEQVSTLDRDTLITRLAMMQTLEDNGGGVGDEFHKDVQRLEIAMRIRGINNPQKKGLLLDFIKTGTFSPLLFKFAEQLAPKGVDKSHAALKGGFNDSREDLKMQLEQIKKVTDANEDGILVSDLIQKYDFLSIFVYKHPVSPDLVEEVMTTVDPYVFDKESMFLYTPASFFTGLSGEVNGDTRHFSTYVPEINGFVVEIDNAVVTGAVNNLNINLMGSLGLMSATRRIYNSTIFQKSVYDASEIMGADIISLYQNIYAGKTPLTILTTLLDSLYLLRTTQPKRVRDTIFPMPGSKEDASLVEKWRKEIVAAAADSGGALAPDKIESLIKKRIQAKEKKRKLAFVGGDDGDKRDFIRDSDHALSSYCDILSLRAFNQYKEKTSTGAYKGPMHMFNIPSYLYSNVMRGRRFNVKVPTKSSVDKLKKSLPFDYNPTTGDVGGAFDPWGTDVSAMVRTELLKETDGSGGSILEINPALDTGYTDPATGKAAKDFKAYFIFLNDSLGTFVADLKTPFEIMNEVVKSCYLELFETPGGRFIFRTPQYNNNEPIFKTYRGGPSGQSILTKTDETAMVTGADGEFKAKGVDKDAAGQAHMLTSDDVISISTSYHQSAQNLVAKQSLGYGVDLINVPIDQLYYFYTNGKVVAQYGLTVGAPVVNPNVRFKSKITLENTGGEVDAASYSKGVFSYCRFFLEYSNIKNFSGNVTAVGDPKIQVGRTYFDADNQKFGYITRVSKELTVGQTYTCSFRVDAVRDAVYGKIAPGEAISRPVFRKLPTLEEMVGQFSAAAKTVKHRASHQASYETATNIDAMLLGSPLRGILDPRGKSGPGILTDEAIAERQRQLESGQDPLPGIIKKAPQGGLPYRPGGTPVSLPLPLRLHP